MATATRFLVLVAMVMISHLTTVSALFFAEDTQSDPCQEQCVSHKNGSLHCANSFCTAFPSIPESAVHVFLQNNLISVIPALECNSVTLLNLSLNHVEALNSTAFALPSALDELFLDHNLLTVVDAVFFKNMIKLRRLFLNDNRITRIEANAFRPTALEFLDLSGNALHELGMNALSDLGSLAHVHLDDNQLSFVNASMFKGLTRLQFLFLSNNRIRSVEEKTFYECSHLESIDLRNNSIEKIDAKAFSYASSLRVVHLSFNRIKELDKDTFQTLGQDGGRLDAVYLDHNPLEKLTAGLFPPSTSRVSLQHLHELVYVSEGVFEGIDLLKEVILRHNPKLIGISSQAFGGAKGTPVQALHISNNSLESIFEETLDWRRLSLADFSLNPWRCDCNIAWLIDADLPGRTLDVAKCASPDHLAGRSISSLDHSDFSCNILYFYKRRVIRGVLAGFFITMIALLCLLVYFFRYKLFARCLGPSYSYKSVYNSGDDNKEALVDIDWEKNKAREEVDDAEEVEPHEV